MCEPTSEELKIVYGQPLELVCMLDKSGFATPGGKELKVYIEEEASGKVLAEIGVHVLVVG